MNGIAITETMIIICAKSSKTAMTIFILLILYVQNEFEPRECADGATHERAAYANGGCTGENYRLHNGNLPDTSAHNPTRFNGKFIVTVSSSSCYSTTVLHCSKHRSAVLLDF